LNWRQICSDVQDFLSEFCNDLVTSDGYALTSEGKVALERIACGGQAILRVLSTICLRRYKACVVEY
jgi:hypothetical protein